MLFSLLCRDNLTVKVMGRSNIQKYCSLLLLFLAIAIKVSANQHVQRVLLPPIHRIEFLQARQLSDSEGNIESVLIPLKRVGRLFLIEASVDGQTGNFVFDTGADKMVLNKTYFRNNLMTTTESGGGLTGNSQIIYITQVKEIVASELIFGNQTADVTDLGQIENRRKSKILGLFGMSLFTNMHLEIDLRNATLRLSRLNKSGVPENKQITSFSGDFIGKIHLVKRVMFLEGTIGGKTLDFCLDTGAESNVMSSSAPKRVMESITISSRSDLTGVGGANAEVLFGTMNNFVLGTLKLGPMQTIVASLTSLSQAYEYPVSGILGFDFFDQGVISINLVTREFSFFLHREKNENNN